MPRQRPDPVRDAAVALAAIMKHGTWVEISQHWALYHNLWPEIADRYLTPAIAKGGHRVSEAQQLSKDQKLAVRALDKSGLPRDLRETAKRMVADGIAEIVDPEEGVR